jgi:hypothetical protein
MPPLSHHSNPASRLTALLSCLAVAALSACGGGEQSDIDASTAAASTAESPPAARMAGGAAAAVNVEVLPTFHMAPAMLDEPSDVDAGGTSASGHAAPQRFAIDESLARLATARLTPQMLSRQIDNERNARSASAVTATLGASTTPQAQSIAATVYTPAQIRAAYGLPTLPAVGAALSASVAAALGAGQTIYLVDANDNPNALSDLNRFSAKFGLPACTSAALPSSLPLSPAGSNCSFSVAYTDGSGTLKSGAPAYSAGWAPEIALDVQWAHAIAPLARLVLIEVNDSMSSDLLGGVALANKMGAGVVSMSFGAVEGAWVTGTDSAFTAAGMTYIASTGDAGNQVNWPAVSPHVLAVGGTSLAWSGSGTRYEAAWSGAGGGISAFEALPSWQSGVKMPGFGAVSRRSVSDVSFNADPTTGQYVALTAPGATTTSWNSYGGTSIAAPQWAGLVAVANAQRVAAAKAMLGDVHPTIYASIAAVPGTYAAVFRDVADGNDGACASCTAAAGYDQPTGWGTPNAASLWSALNGAGASTSASTTVAAPVVPGGDLLAKTKVALTQSLGIAAPVGVTTSYALAGAPAGLVVDSAGELKWASPVTGSYKLVVTAKTSAGKSAAGNYTLKVIPYSPPILSGGTALAASVGKAFGATLVASNPDNGTLTFSLAGAPPGLSVGAGGVLSWPAPVAGTYALPITVKDNYGMSSTRGYVLSVVGVNHAPTLASGTLSAKAGIAFGAGLWGHDVDGDALAYSLAGAPAGLGLSALGALNWARPVKGTYALKVTVKDSHGLAGAVATITLVVKA